MRKLLLLLPLVLAMPVVAESDPFGLGEHAYKKFQQHADNFFETDDPELSCSEMRMASTVIKTQLDLLQDYAPQEDWIKKWDKAKGFIADFCIPHGY